MAFFLLPTHMCENIYEVDYEALARRGIRLILSDLDNTLIPYSSGEPTPELRAWVERLRKLGLTVFVLSNSRKSRRCPSFCQALGVPFLSHAGKPKAKGYRKAMERMGVSVSETVMLGDQLYTDVLGANLVGIEAWLVRPIEFGNPLRVLRYGAELPFRALAQKREEACI